MSSSHLDRWITCLELGCVAPARPTTTRCLEHLPGGGVLAVAEAYAIAMVLYREHGESFYQDERRNGARLWLSAERKWGAEVEWFDRDLLKGEAYKADAFPRYIHRAALEWLHHPLLWS